MGKRFRPRTSERRAVRGLLTRSLGRWVSGIVLLVLLTLVGWVVLSVRIGAVLTDSMDPTFVPGDQYVIRIDAYRSSPPQRGDIVVIRHPEGHETLLKRVIGVPGDMVGVRFGRAWVNGEWVVEPYIKDVPGVREKPVLTKVPEGRVFLLGDNRNFSEDSRDLGTLPVKDVLGRVVAIIYPMHRRQKLPQVQLDAPDVAPK